MAQAGFPKASNDAASGADSAAPATSSDAEKRAYLRMMSHELRTPLNSILGFSEIISSELYGPLGAPQYKEYAQIIQASGVRLLKLVNQMVEMARLEGRAVEMEPQLEPIDHVVDDVLENLREDLERNRTLVLVAERGDLPTVMADPRALRMVLTNLVHNACVHAPEGSAITLGSRDRGDVIELWVADNGPGIEPGDIDRILRPFEQGDAALTRRHEGAGLGLPIADLACQAMGGRLTLTSEPGRGLKAVVTLPAA